MPAASSYPLGTLDSTDFLLGTDAAGAVIRYLPSEFVKGFAAVGETVLDVTGSHTAARTAGTYMFAQGNPLAITGVGTLYAPDIVRIAAVDFPAVLGLTAKLAIRMNVAVNDVAPGGSLTFGLHPVTRPAVSGGAGVAIYTIGAAIAGSTVAVTPAADAHVALLSADFALPADGFYCIGMVAAAAVAASSHLHLSGRLLSKYS